ncbi:MAG: class I SAM-dependent methyltransferase [Acidimicrobiia bacterium]|nr:class I SAM-dependent methyltransferase [Acidimicrobiia bacterium]
MSSTTHWEAVYSGRATEDLGWYEPRPSTLDLVLRFSAPTDAVIDVGGGDSRLVDELLHAGYEQITVLDLSQTALDRARSRLGPASGNVSWIRGDVTGWTPPRRWDLWHDRAVFHFLVKDQDRSAYMAAALQSLSAGGKMIVATFAPDGPEQCAGLPVERYDAKGLAAVFAPEFRLVEHHRLQAGPTGIGDTRPYVAAVLERG